MYFHLSHSDILQITRVFDNLKVDLHGSLLWLPPKVPSHSSCYLRATLFQYSQCTPCSTSPPSVGILSSSESDSHLSESLCQQHTPPRSKNWFLRKSIFLFFAFVVTMSLLATKPLYSTMHTSIIQDISLDSMVCDTDEFRQNWTTAELKQLALEIEDSPAPLIVERVESGSEELYHIIFGSKYFIAANMLGLESLPGLILQSQDSNTVQDFLGSTVFNWDHLDEIECARAYQWLRSVCNYSVDQIAKLRHISRPVIGNQLRLLKLPKLIQEYLQQGHLNKSHCFLLLKLNNAQDQVTLAKEVVDGTYSVRELKRIVEERQPPLMVPVSQKVDSNLHITVSEHSIEIAVDSPETKKRLLDYLQNFS